MKNLIKMDMDSVNLVVWCILLNKGIIHHIDLSYQIIEDEIMNYLLNGCESIQYENYSFVILLNTLKTPTQVGV